MALDERSSRERAFVYPEALYPDDFDPTTYEVALGTTYLNAIIDVYPRVNTATHTITLPPASADLAGSKIGFSGPSNALILVKSLVNKDPNRTILVSLQGRGEFVVLNNGNGDYNWHTRSLDQPGVSGSFDPYEVPLAIRQAVVDGFAAQDAAGNDSAFLSDPQPAGSMVGYDFADPDNNYNYVFKPVPFADGCYNVWCSFLLSR